MPSSSTPRATSASPPPQPPPTLSTPGPRASTLQKLFNDALAHTLKTCSYSNFASCFPTPAKYVPEALDQLHRDFIGRLDAAAKNEFRSLLEERNVVANLNELDGLIADAKKRKEKAESDPDRDVGMSSLPVPPHLLPPSSLVSAYLSPFLNAQHAELSGRLEDTQNGNRELAAKVNTQRTEIEQLVSGLEGFITDLERAASALQGQEMQGIEQELAQGATTRLIK